MNEIALNLWDADEYGDGTNTGIMLTAYLIDEDLAVRSSAFVSVSLSKSDLPKSYLVDDEWAYPGSRKFVKWLQLLVAKQIERTPSGNI